jgi:uncharacterized protein
MMLAHREERKLRMAHRSNHQHQFIYVLEPTRLEMLSEGPTDEEVRALQAHVEYLERLAEADVVLLAGRTQEESEGTFGLVIVQADSEEGARAVMADDPGVKQGVMTATLHPYRIAVLGRSLGGPL